MTLKGAKLEFFLFYTTKFQKFLANNFFLVHCLVIISIDLKSAKNSAYFFILIFIENIFEYSLELVECKFAKMAEPIEKLF